MKIKIFKKSEGFTLIELLIVMGVIAVLAALSLFSLQGARESARDARRKADLETIRSGLELYKADCGVYPILITAGASLVGSGSASCPANTYLQVVPDDPVAGRDYHYITSSPYTTYTICAALESDTTIETACTTLSANCGSGVNCSYFVVNP